MDILMNLVDKFSSTSLGSLRKFSLDEIKLATNNCDKSLVIWRSCGSGEVYKGTIYDYVGTTKLSKTVAIRCFSSMSWQPTPKWIRYQLFVYSQSCHKHIVPVIGYYYEKNLLVTVYEYMPNGSLANHLCRKTTPFSFSYSWEQCLGICIEAARGLEFLHTTPNIRVPSDPLFIHCDVTATNILLDENGVAKISDMYSEVTWPFTASSMDPECHILKTGSDVYAFGLLLVKVLARKVSFDEEDLNLGKQLRKYIVDGTLDQIIHPTMKALISPDCLKAIVQVAGECLQTNSDNRPTIAEVVEKLERAMAESSSQRTFRRYSFNEVKVLTKNFDNILGEGGEGKVYQGATEANITVAVKLLKSEHSSEIEKEIKMLSKLDHPNLVPLLGYSDESDGKILVYECMSNGSLQSAFKRNLSWEQLLNICVGVARGLRYLHTGTKDSPKGIIHRDMKPGNILLDENFVAKISDFGLSKMSTQDQVNSEITTMFKGTLGYYAPEYLQNRYVITRKIDVYAFGMILCDVLCRKKPADREESFYINENERYSLWAKQNVLPDLKGAISPECLEGFTDILEKCLDSNPRKRPSMEDVVFMLESTQKWQVAWQKNDIGGLFYLPHCKEGVVVYCASTPEDNSRTSQDCLKVRLLLRRFGLHVDERDPTKDLYSREFKQVFGNSKDVRLPQVFIQGKYMGGVEILYKARQLATLLGVSPRFICQKCEEAMACDECIREQWYVLCKNCDALTIVSKDLGRESRSCLECNYGANELIYKSILEIH